LYLSLEQFLVTSEYTITFTDSISEFEMLLLCKLGDDFSYNEDYTVCTIESLMGEREFIREIADLVDVENIGLIQHLVTMEPDWLNFKS
jgi:hypothetical protein